MVLRRTYSASYNFRVCVLAFLWLGALISGVCITTYRSLFSTLMRMCAATHVSIVGLVVTLFLPYVIAVLSIHYDRPAVIYCLSTIKAYCSGVSLALIYTGFGTGCWIALPLILFSMLAGNVYLLYLCIRYIGSDKQLTLRNAVFSFIGILIIGIIDYLIISPFLVEVMNRC